ncbi:MAG: ATP-binding protein, partial [Brachymonas sp.]
VGEPISEAVTMPQVPGELGDLARAMQAMRERLEGRDYIENHVRALTHELKSPVAAISASGELLEGDLPAADRQRFAAQVVAQSQRLQRLVDQMLELSKLEQRAVSGGRLQHLQPHPLADLVRHVIAQHAPTATIKNIALYAYFMPADGPFFLKIEPDLLALALSNLIDNAVDFSPPGSQVRIQLCEEEIDQVQQVRLSVQDAGPGVPDFALPRLGERFFTTPRSNGQRSGSGLGLAIVQGIVRLHGGQLLLRNTSPGFCAEIRLAK